MNSAGLFMLYVAFRSANWYTSHLHDATSVAISPKELGVRCQNVWNFAQGLKLKPIFTQKWASVGLHLLQQFQHCMQPLLHLPSNNFI